jgi:hypothetical protein
MQVRRFPELNDVELSYRYPRGKADPGTSAAASCVPVSWAECVPVSWVECVADVVAVPATLPHPASSTTSGIAKRARFMRRNRIA